jgi:diaminohydroxyphosphoribosylaminopyrimidine deaminase/5-amino-6-(5-phosphoribosylamino)uracil reductase
VRDVGWPSSAPGDARAVVPSPRTTADPEASVHGHHPSRESAAASTAEREAMQRALELASRGPAEDANPQVGCVLLGPDGWTLGEGLHEGAGTPHAEVAALADARSRGNAVRGATAVVTLEPCRHTGRTGPCTRALIDAGIGRVVYALSDPGASSGGGGRELAEAGVEVCAGVLEDSARHLIGRWYAAAGGGPHVHIVLKTATTLDGMVAAADGSSRWITGERSRAHAHTVRSRTDAILVGTGTVLADDPSLTARPEGPGERTPQADRVVQAAQAAQMSQRQPWRVVVGRRPIPATAAVRGEGGPFLQVRSHDPRTVVDALAERGIRHAVLEGGPRLATAFLRAGLVDELHAYLAPLHLGVGTRMLGDLGIPALDQAPRWHTTDVQRLGEDVLIIASR